MPDNSAKAKITVEVGPRAIPELPGQPGIVVLPVSTSSLNSFTEAMAATEKQHSKESSIHVLKNTGCGMRQFLAHSAGCLPGHDMVAVESPLNQNGGV